MNHFADRLMEACRKKGTPVCVGLDPVAERLPASIAGKSPESRIQAFCSGVLRAVAPHVPCVKIQSACFERYFGVGVEVCRGLITEARALGLIVILDAKRGDIGASSEHYAAGCLAGADGPDALTVNAYLGADGLEPFIKVAASEGKGLFALVRTSNPGGDAVQSLHLKDGRTVAEAVAGVVATAGASHVGKNSYSLLGAVVGATKAADAQNLRRLMPQQIFLVPGFGAQGGKADDVKACFKPDGTGAIVTASRSVLYAYEKAGAATSDWKGAVERAAVEMKQQVAEALR